MKQITFGEYRSFDDLSLILQTKSIGSPSIKTHYVEIEGADGVLDYTDYFGEARFGNVILTFTFQTIVVQSQFLTLFSAIKDALHGKKLRIVLDDDSSFYYEGRITVSEFTSEKAIGTITITCDCDPFKYKFETTKESFTCSGERTIVLSNSRKRVVPTITTNAEFTISFGGYTVTHSAGTFKIPTLELKEGNNSITVNGNGNISFEYQEGGL